MSPSSRVVFCITLAAAGAATLYYYVLAESDDEKSAPVKSTYPVGFH